MSNPKSVYFTKSFIIDIFQIQNGTQNNKHDSHGVILKLCIILLETFTFLLEKVVSRQKILHKWLRQFPFSLVKYFLVVSSSFHSFNLSGNNYT